MTLNRKKWFGLVCLCGMFLFLTPGRAEAAVYENQIGVETSSSYILKIDAPKAQIRKLADSASGAVGEVRRGETLSVISWENGWARVSCQAGDGYIKVSEAGTMVETTREQVDEQTVLRNHVVTYALQFVGGRYVWGGTDPHTGADCSGFTSYVMRHAAGISLSHSSAAQAGEGRKVSEPRPGDLIFYAGGGRINHVAIYIGGGQIVHASTEKTGIKVSRWDHRTPVKIVSVLD